MVRRLLRALAWLGFAVVTAAGVLAIYVALNWDRSWNDVPMPDLHATADPAMIARGEYLATGPAHCTECHVASFDRFQRFYDGEQVPLTGGYPFQIGPLATLYSKNLTPDVETGIGRYTDPQIARMLRHGVRPDGQASVPLLMPYGNMSDEDIVAILSFLRAQPPVRSVVPDNEWTMVGKVMRTFVAAARPNMDVRPARTAPPQEPTVERGSYIARSVANCGGCHTAFNEMTGVSTAPMFSGGNVIEPPNGARVDRAVWFRPPNITPHPGSALSKFPDRQTFIARFRVGGRHYDGSPMPWEAFGKMAPEDIAALYEFLHAQPVAGMSVPDDPRVRRD